MRGIAICYWLLWAIASGVAALSVKGADSVVVFNEIDYHPAANEAAEEWVELHNQMAIDIDVSAWFLDGDIRYTFGEGTIIPGGGYIVIASDPAALRSVTGTTNVLGPFVGRLNNATGNLELRDRNRRLMDKLEYRDRGKWPVAPDGSGATLAKADENTTSDDPQHWTSSVAVGGTPGERNFPAGRQILRRGLISFNALWRFEATGANLGTAWREPGFDDSGWPGRNNATLVSYWPFNGNATATRGTSGSLVGPVASVTDRNGVPGVALGFNGASQTYVSVPGGGGLNGAASATVSMWVKWTGTQDSDCCGGFGAVLARQANGLFSDNILALNNSNPDVGRLVWRQSGGPAPVLITGTTPVGTNWHHIAVTFGSGGGSTLYVDGGAQGTASGAGLNNNSSIALSIGAWAGDGAGFATASIDDVAIWDQPLSGAQIAQLAAQSRTPLDFAAPESAVYFAGDGRLASSDELRRTSLPLGPNTYYFRNAFVFGDDPAGTELKLDLAVDDGAVFYLNGAEVYRHNMPGGAIDYSTFASVAVGDAPISNAISIPVTDLVRGTNIFAVEVHQAAPGDAGMIFGAGLTGFVTIEPQPETQMLIGLSDVWRYDARDVDLGDTWRSAAYNDSTWLTGASAIFAGSATIDGLAPEKVTNITATASTQYTNDGRLAIHAVNGAGLVGNTHVNTPANTMWLNNGTFGIPNDLNPFITFDLGAIYPLRRMKVWNYNEYLTGRPELLARGVSRADVLSGVASGSFSSLITGQSFDKAPGTQTDFSQLIDLGGVNARYVRLEKLTNFPGGDNNFVGLSEVQFFRDASINRTGVPLGPVTYYFRKAFNFTGDPARTTLLLNAAVDDGAVFYLNGTEIDRINMPSGAVGHTTLASSAVGNATLGGAVTIPNTSLVRGTNVLAIEVHQASASGDPDMIFALELNARIAPRSPDDFDAGNLLFSEITAALASPFAVELVNRGTSWLDVGGYIIQRRGPSPDADHILVSQTIGPGEFRVLDQATLGFSAAVGDKLFLLRPGGRGVLDAVEVHERPRARPADGSEWLTPAAVTPGASNSFALRDEIVINEIMYHAPPRLEEPVVIGTNFFISISNLWKYEQSGTDLGTGWRAPAYDDSGWPSGAALLYVSTNNLPAPKNTPLSLGPVTYYFRASFVYTGAPTVLSLSLRYLVDDAAVFYMNGKELTRFNLSSAPVTYTNWAAAQVGTATFRTFNVALTNLVIGTNVFAAEVHQAMNTGDDVVFGAELSGRVEAVPRVPFSRSDEGWVELFNRSSNVVDLTNWRIDEGIDFRFASNTMIAPGGYLVVANDRAGLLAKFPGINVVGPFTNTFSYRGERIVLKDGADNPADVVHYFDDGRWPRGADGRGSSLELRDPHADNAAGEAWAASDESTRSSWRTYSYRGVAAASPVGPDGQWHEFVMGLLDSGEVLLDDITVVELPGNTNLIQNSTFQTGTNTWRIIGNHHGEVIDDPDQPGNKVLRLIANGSTEHMSNHGETTLLSNRDIVNGREYIISFRAKWISGCRQFHTRLYFNRLPHTTLLDAPALHGTPGSQNTAFVTNIGPTFAALRHDPPVPAPFAPVTISVHAEDPDGVSAVNLWTAVDGGSWASQPMTISQDGSYAASLPGKAAGTMVQFYVEAADALGAISTFPQEGRNSRVLYKVDDGLAATNGLHNFRIVTLTRDTDELFRTINLMSNERIGCTVIYDEEEIFYDAGLRLKGSEHSRTVALRLGFNVAFTSEQRFRGVHSTVAIDRSESTGFGQREMLIHQTLNHAGGVPTKYHDLVQVMAPRPEYTGSAELQLARYSDVFLDDQFENGSDGTVYEYELVYQLLPPTDNGTPEGNKIPAPDQVMGTTIHNMGDDKENYRWTFLIKNNEDHDDFSRLMAFCKIMEMTGASFTGQITNYIDVDRWLRGTAVNALSGVGDSYGGDGSQHNVQFYVRPSDGLVVYFPHDMDAFFSATRPIVPNSDMSKIIAVPAWARAYYSHLLDIIGTTYNGNYMTRWANHFGRLLPAQDFAGHLAFLIQRANFVTTQVNSAVPNVAFAITSNGGNNFGTTNNIINLIGSANLSVRTIEVNGVAYPITWTSVTGWSVSIPLFAGANSIRVQGVNSAGVRLTNAIDTIIITNNGSGAPLPVVINEWMADNAAPYGFADPVDGHFDDWFELFNPNTNALNIGGFFLTDDLGLPMKWQIPTPTMIGARDFLLVWADNETEQNGNTNGHLHAGFQLNRNGESIGLFSPTGVAQHTVTFGAQYLNVSQGLFPDGSTNVYYMTNWTPRASNMLTPPLQITAIDVADDIVTLTWAAIPGVSYRVQYTDRLAEDAEWITLGAPVLATGRSVSVADTPGGVHRFYRITRADP
jgi:hypothetical protein